VIGSVVRAEKSHSSGKKPNFDPKPQKSRNDSSYQLSFISDSKCVLEYIGNDTYSEQGSYLWNKQLEKGTVTIDDDDYTLTKDNENRILILEDGDASIFSLIQKKSGNSINLKNTIWIGFENDDIIKLQFNSDNSFVFANITLPNEEENLNGVFTWNDAERKGTITIGSEHEIMLSKSGNLLEIHVPQYDGRIGIFGYIRIK